MFSDLLFLTGKCTVVSLNDSCHVFPIFKNGNSSIMELANRDDLRLHVNEEISALKEIKVFIRDPKQRFISGVNTFASFSQRPVDDLLTDIQSYKVYDRHFIPQYLWLMHLHKHFKGDVELLPVSDLRNMVDLDYKPNTVDQIERIRLIVDQGNFDGYTKVDEKMINNFMNKTVNLQTLIERHRHDLP